jgi:hypothetical protein
LAKNSGSTQTEIISKCIANTRLNEGRGLALDSMSNGGITEDEEAIRALKQFGIATASGFAGYHIAGYIRKQFELDENKGTQILIGMLAGLGTLLFQAYNSSKTE